jgi:putative Mn2+ efflux pump MntP
MHGLFLEVQALLIKVVPEFLFIGQNAEVVMGIIELLFTAIGLSMDAFAVAVCQGLSTRKTNLKKALVIGLYFGGFQAIMPLIGYLVGSQFSSIIADFDHWIAFGLLAFIGAKMIWESFRKENQSSNSSVQVSTDGAGLAGSTEKPVNAKDPSLTPAKMLPLALATSIDALAAGVSFAFLHVNIVPAVLFIGVITLFLSMAGVKVGSIFGAGMKSKAELIGGIILIAIGLKSVLEHTGFLP